MGRFQLLRAAAPGREMRSSPTDPSMCVKWWVRNLIENLGHQSQSCTMQSVFSGPVYVVRDNIDTDQIIPAQYLNLVRPLPEEYKKLGSYALCGLPESLYAKRYIEEGQLDSRYPIIVGGRNF